MRIRSKEVWKVAWIAAIPLGLFAAYYCAYFVWLTAYYSSDPDLRHAQHGAYLWFAITAICFLTVVIAVVRGLVELVRFFRSGGRQKEKGLPNKSATANALDLT